MRQDKNFLPVWMTLGMTGEGSCGMTDGWSHIEPGLGANTVTGAGIIRGLGIRRFRSQA